MCAITPMLRTFGSSGNVDWAMIAPAGFGSIAPLGLRLIYGIGSRGLTPRRDQALPEMTSATSPRVRPVRLIADGVCDWLTASRSPGEVAERLVRLGHLDRLLALAHR